MKIGVHHFISGDNVCHDICIVETDDEGRVMGYYVFEQEEHGVIWRGGNAYEDKTGKLILG